MGARESYANLGERMKLAFANQNFAKAEELANAVFSIGFAHVSERPQGSGWMVSDRRSPNYVPYRGSREQCIAFYEGYQQTDYYEDLVVCVDSEKPVIVWPEELFGEHLVEGKTSE